MADYFFGSSALVKAYIAETGTNWVRTILDDPQHRISIQILEAAVENARNHSLRAYDAVQLASAIAVNTALLVTQDNAGDFTFVSADQALNDAARQERLQVEDPNFH